MYNYVHNARWLLRLTLLVGIACLAFSFGGVAKADCSVQPTVLVDTDTVFGYVDGFNLKGLAQSFIPSCSGVISQVLIVGGYNDNGLPADIRVDIEGDSSGSPDGVSVSYATSPYSNFPTGGVNGTYTFTLSAPVSVVSGTTYWVVFTSPGNNSGTHYWKMAGSAIDSYGSVATGDDTLTTWTSPPYNSTTALNLSMGVVSGGTPTTTPSSMGTTTVIMDPNRDFFNGILLFMGGMVFVIWLFRRRK